MTRINLPVMVLAALFALMAGQAQAYSELIPILTRPSGSSRP